VVHGQYAPERRDGDPGGYDVRRRTDSPGCGGHYRPIVHIPAAIAANNQGLIGVRVNLGSRARKVDIPMGFERYGDLDPQELEIYLDNALVLMGVSGTISGEPGVFQLPDAQ